MEVAERRALPSPLLIAAAAGVAVLLVKGRRPLSVADGPQLRRLAMTKTYLLRDIEVCAAKVEHEQKRFTFADELGVVAALVSVVHSPGNIKGALAAARTANAVGNAVGWGHKEVAQLCPGVRERVAVYAKDNDDISAALGLDPNLTAAQVLELARQAGITNINRV